MRIEEITLELTTRCNLRCRICSLWQSAVDLPLEEAREFVEQFFPVGISLTGGEVFLWPHIDEFLSYLLVNRIKGRVDFLHISTNAALPQAKEVLERFFRFLPLMSITVSLDGIKGVHDAQRGVSGAFERSLKFLLWLRKVGVRTTIKMVITSINQDEVYKVWRLAKELKMAVYFKPFEELDLYYHRFSSPQSLHPDSKVVAEQLEKVSEEARGESWLAENQYFFFALEKVKEYFDLGKITVDTCRVPERFLFVTAYGDVYSCLYGPRLGDIRSGIDWQVFDSVAKDGLEGRCKRCLAYHGYLQDYNLSRD